MKFWVKVVGLRLNPQSPSESAPALSPYSVQNCPNILTKHSKDGVQKAPQLQNMAHQWHQEEIHMSQLIMDVRPAKTQISLIIRPVWSESSLYAHWVTKDPNFLHANRSHMLFCWFCQGFCHLLMCLNIAGRVANSVGPDQTPRSVASDQVQSISSGLSIEIPLQWRKKWLESNEHTHTTKDSRRVKFSRQG